MAEDSGDRVLPAPPHSNGETTSPTIPHATHESATSSSPSPGEVTFNVGAFKHTIGERQEGEQKKDEELLEHESKLLARQRMTEQEKEWKGGIKTALKRAIPRWWKYGIHSTATYAKEKAQAQQMLAESGLQMQSLPYEFQRQIRETAQHDVQEERQDQSWIKKRIASIKDLRHAATITQNAIDKKEIEIVQTLRKATFATHEEINSDEALKRFVDNNQGLINSYKSVLSGDFQAAEGLAGRLSNEMADDAIRTAVGEKKASEIEFTGEIKNFFTNEVITPLLKEGLSRGGRISENTLLEVRTKVQEVFFTKKFTDWRNSLPEDVRAKFDLSLSYGTDIIPTIQEALIPQALAIKEQLKADSDIDQYVNAIVLKVNVGTLKSGEQGDINESWTEQKAARSITNERVLELYKQIEEDHGPDPIIPEAYQAAITRANRLTQLGGRLGVGHTTVGLGVGFGLYAARIGAGTVGRIAVPLVGGSLAAGIVRGIQERGRFTREVEQHRIEASRGIAFDEEAKRRKEMQELEMPTVDIQTEVIDRLTHFRTELAHDRVTEENILQAIGILTDIRARRFIMDTDETVELYRTTTDRSLNAQKTLMELRRAQTMSQLRTYLSNPDHASTRDAVLNRLGISLPSGTDTLDGMISTLQDAQIQNLQRGTALQPDVALALGLTTVEQRNSIDGRERAMRRARAAAMIKQGSGTFAMAFVGGMVTQEALAGVTRVLGGTTQPTIIERAFGAQEVPRVHVTETFLEPSAKLQSEKVMGHTIRFPVGSHWEPNKFGTPISDAHWVEMPDGKWNLVLDNDSDKVLISEASFKKGHFVYNEADSLIKHQHVKEIGEGTHAEKKAVFGEKGVWKEHETKVKGWDWYGYDTKISDRNELDLETFKKGNDITLQMNGMGWSEASSVKPPRLFVPSVQKSGDAAFAFTIPGRENTPLIVRADHGGNLRLDPNNTKDYVHFVGKNGKDGGKMKLGEFSKMILNPDAYKKEPNGQIQTEVAKYRRGLGRIAQLRDTFNLGGKDGHGRGRISAGTLIDGRWHSFATIFGEGKTPDKITTHVKNPVIVEIKPPILTEHKTIDAPEIPPIPLPWSRRPLEAGKSTVGTEKTPLENIQNQYYGGMNLEQLQEWIKLNPSKLHPYTKKEPTTTQSEEERAKEPLWVDKEGNPISRNIDRERETIERYLDTFDPEYRSYLENLMESPTFGEMTPENRVSVNIPAWLEEKNLYNLLDQYAPQVDRENNPLDPKLFEINILVNRKTGTPEDGSVNEIQRFIEDARNNGKEYHINFVNVEFDPPFNNVGHARKVITDLTLMRSLKRDQQDGPLYMESEDADLVRVDAHTVINLIEKLDENPHLDAVRGTQDRLPEVLMNNDFLFLFRRMWDFNEILLRSRKYRPENNPDWNFTWHRIITGGWNTGYSAEAIALIGGYDSLQTKGEDLSVGEKMTMIRGDGTMPNLDVVGRVATRSDSSPRRFLAEVFTGQSAYGPSFEDEAFNRNIRDMSFEDMLAKISDTARINETNSGQFAGMLNGMLQATRELTPTEEEAMKTFNTNMLWLGFDRNDYTFDESGELRIHNWENIKQALENYRQKHGGTLNADLTEPSRTNVDDTQPSEMMNPLEVELRRQEVTESSAESFLGREITTEELDILTHGGGWADLLRPTGRQVWGVEPTDEQLRAAFIQMAHDYHHSPLSNEELTRIFNENIWQPILPPVPTEDAPPEDKERVAADLLPTIADVEYDSFQESGFIFHEGRVTTLRNYYKDTVSKYDLVDVRSSDHDTSYRIHQVIDKLEDVFNIPPESNRYSLRGPHALYVVSGEAGGRFVIQGGGYIHGDRVGRNNGSDFTLAFTNQTSQEYMLNWIEQDPQGALRYVFASIAAQNTSPTRDDVTPQEIADRVTRLRSFYMRRPNGEVIHLDRDANGRFHAEQRPQNPENPPQDQVDVIVPATGATHPPVRQAPPRPTPPQRPIIQTATVESETPPLSPERTQGSIATEASEYHPQRNEDAAFSLEEQQADGVFDGMGGHAAGEVASRIASEVIEDDMSSLPPDNEITPDEMEQRIATMLREANNAVLAEAARNPQLKGMGTTATITKLLPGENEDESIVVSGNVGDSRAYLLSEDGTLQQLTEDDTGYGYTERQRYLLNTVRSYNELSGDDIEDFENAITTRNVIGQALGNQTIRPRTGRATLRKGQRLLLTTDGIHDNLTQEEIAEILRQYPNNEEASRALVAAAQARSRDGSIRSKADDMTAIVRTAT